MGLMLIGLAVAGYMAYQRYYAHSQDEVKIQGKCSAVEVWNCH